ncbi:hypothetical protein [Methylocella sp.]|uniref:hypothetical protein n=1 Tax=Methylocella sp. TaxID=1978226 RepID=UPI00378349F0
MNVRSSFAALGVLLAAASFQPFASVAVAPARAEPAAANLDDVVFSLGSTTFRLKRIEVLGGPASNAELAKLFDPAAPLPLAERLAGLSAASVKIPELAIETKIGERTQSFVYRDVVLEGVEHGTARAAKAQGASFRLSDPNEGEARGAYGEIDAKNFDLALAARMAQGAPPAQGAAKAQLYEALSVQGVHFESARAELDAQSVTADRAFGRPPAQAPAKPAESSPQAERRLEQAELLRWLDAIRLEGVGVSEARLSLRLGDSPVDVKAARVALPQLDGARIDSLRADNLTYARDDRTIAVSAAEFKAIDLEALTDRERRGDPSSPAFGALVLSKIAGTSAERPEEKDFTLERLEIDNGAQAASGDLTLDVAFDRLRAQAARVPAVAALGYSDIDASGRFSALWRREARELAVSGLSLDVADMGAFKLTALFAGFGPDLASSDSATSAAALRSVRLKTFDMNFVNRGLVERALAAQAERAGVSVDEARQSDMQNASLLLPALGGNAPPLRVIGSEAAKFLADPRNFTLVGRSADGVGLHDLELVSTPAAFFKKMEVTAYANR